jgi:very-short-patch-repair endonuclease
LDGYLTEIDGRATIKKLSERRLEIETEQHHAFAEVVRLRTFAGLKRSMTAAVEAALMMFVQAVRRIGAGTGVRAVRHRRTARQAMQTCAKSVPCWIVPGWRVSESLPPELGAFDLVIVDEASQADARLLPALLRGQKLLVVGDDKQVSPDPVAIEERRILQLEHNYLKDQPFKSELLPGSSLYDLMRAIYSGQRLMLREHFRCVEPIIRFSMQFYDEPLEPLRIPKPSERLDPPLIDILVQDGEKHGTTNRAEAKVIVDEMERLTADPAYRERTIGVISLIGRMQAALIQKLLLERIGEEGFLHHQIACGDAPTFQGKERDIMFLSMVASPGDARALTTETFKQRFNVALSRARDRMYLVRSVSEENLRQHDLKAMVIRHFKNPMPDATKAVDDLSSLCESGLERDVYGRLVEIGYRVQPQVRAGGYRIDLVVEGEHDRRLAIELDGDKYHGPERWAEDFGRQQTLERMGWRFWRCWGSSFVRDPGSCMNDLVATLTDFGIEPIGSEPRPNIYTQHLIVSAAPQPVAPEEELAPDQPEPAAPVPMPTEMPDLEMAEGPFVQVGDRIVVRFGDTQNQRTLVLRRQGLDLDNGVITLEHPLGEALLNCSEDDEIEYEFDGRVRTAAILKVEKAALSPMPT